MVRVRELETLIAKIERRRLDIEEKRTLFQFETAFFIPLFAILFLISYFAESPGVKLGFYLFTIVLIVADLVYSIFIYRDLSKKQKKLETLIDSKMSEETEQL